VQVIVLVVELPQLRADGAAHLPHRVQARPEHARIEDTTPVRRHKHHMHMERGNHVPATAVLRRDCQGPVACCGVMQVRYRYRLYPSPGQRQALARVFGCARVVYNDCLVLRDACHAAGEKISDTEVQRRVITLAKLTPERSWLGEVASVALVQACNDARRAYREIGIDLGLATLIVTSDGEIIGNPRFLRAKERALARAQRALSRRRKGSANRGRARHRVAVLHRTVRATRLDHAHKIAFRLVRDNQAVYAEDLCVAGLARTRLARSVQDAGWSQLLRLMEEKAARYGRTFARIGRFEPTSQVCSACGAKDGPKPLHVRAWTCMACGTVHDRDVIAARNILAAGRADKSNACEAGVRPHPVAAGAETGTHRSVA
jgi:transposase